MSPSDIRILTVADAAALLALRREALEQAPLAFLSSPEDDIASSVEAVAALLRGETGSAVFGAFTPYLAGMAGLYRERHAKAAHKAHLWGFYVRPAARRQGFGGRLLDVALEHARGLEGVTSVRLSVSAAAPKARVLYERAGFRVWGREPDALRHDGQTVAEDHMALDL
ncbi:MAG TPA: GNAT family N-acetyltransferase [Kiloniellaceae bacterium]|nr:GNAT family N-acetyltransferase [Kiloniellaceae bacterium]HIP77729.1 GNAT family N-acetyltransferase [Kiloniellaceae bacterium]